MSETTIYLTPQQIEDIESGWYVAVTLGPFDLDTLHAALNGPYFDTTTKSLSDRIQAQIKANHYLAKIGRMVNAIGEPS